MAQQGVQGHMKPQDALLSVSARLCERDDWSVPTSRGDVKRLVAIGWSQMTPVERGDFVAALDHQNNLVARTRNGRR